jgi:hypothetical protein
MAIVVDAVLRISKRVLKNRMMVAIAVLSFVAIFFFNAPFPLLVVTAGLVGVVGGRIAPARFSVIAGNSSSTAAAAVESACDRDAHRPSIVVSCSADLQCVPATVVRPAVAAEADAWHLIGVFSGSSILQ